jgi:hypothetical protein
MQPVNCISTVFSPGLLSGTVDRHVASNRVVRRDVQRVVDTVFELPSTERETRHGQFGRPASRPASGQRDSLDRLSEAAESAPNCLLRRPHCGLRPALGGRERAVLGNEPPKGRDILRDSDISHVGQWDT